ncbi:MAG: hypothetical protein ACXAC8_11910 [Candidatus Hodarchaeales archaeon]|jgi:hypothetical protein
MVKKKSFPRKFGLSEQIYSFKVQDLPVVKFFNIPKEKYDSHPVRAATMKILREGVSEGGSHNRFALNAKEMKKLLKERENIEISLTSLYFHIKKMLDANFITVIEYVKEKRHKIAYYGRTAQINVFYDSEHQIQKYQRMFSEFGKFIKILNPGIDVDELESLPEQYYKLKLSHEEKLAKWLTQYKEIIVKEELSFSEIFNFLILLDETHSEYSSIVKKFKEILPVNIDDTD